MAAWRGDEDNPFHTEVGYWMWDARDSEVVRCFLIPRGSAVVAGGIVAADATTYTLKASVGSQTYGILANNWLDKNARSVSYEVTIDTSVDDEFTYSETTVIQHARMSEAGHPHRPQHAAQDRRRLEPAAGGSAGWATGEAQHVMFEWSEEQLAIRDAVRRFVEEEVKPNVEELEHGDTPPYEVIRKLYRTFGLDALARDSFKRALERKTSGAPAARARPRAVATPP